MMLLGMVVGIVCNCEVNGVLVVELVEELVSGLRVVCGWEVMSMWVEGNPDVPFVVISSDAVNKKQTIRLAASLLCR